MADRSSMAERLLRRAQNLREKRQSVFDSPCQEISQYFWPDVSDINTEKTEGTVGWFDRIFETTGIRATQTCSVGVRNWVTPSTDPWLGLVPPRNLEVQQQDSRPGAKRISRVMAPPQGTGDEQGQDEATKWLGDAAEEEMSALSGSSFYSVIQPFNRSACTFGTALMFCEEGKNEPLQFEQFKFGTYVIAENAEKHVDTVFRWFRLTNRQAAQKFGEDELPKRIRDSLASGKYDEMATYVHCCLPNEDVKQGRIGAEGMAVASFYIEEKSKKMVQQGGYEEMPYFCLRFSRWGTDDQPYGCSPAFETLPEARELNFVTQFRDALVELKAFPRVLAPDNLDGCIEMAAGAFTVVQADQMVRGAIPKEWMTQGQTEQIDQMVAEKRKAINDAFFVNIFTMLQNLQGKFTAYEIAQRVGEQLDQFTGTFDQYVTDLINPLVKRVTGIMYRSGALGTPPQSLMVQPGGDPKAEMQLSVPKIVIQSRVTLAIKALRNTGVQNTLATLQPLAEQRPEILDNFDLDEVARQVGRDFGMNEKLIRKMKDLVTIRQQRQQMIAANQSLDLAGKAASAGKDLGKSPKPMQDQVMGALQSTGTDG